MCMHVMKCMVSNCMCGCTRVCFHCSGDRGVRRSRHVHRCCGRHLRRLHALHQRLLRPLHHAQVRPPRVARLYACLVVVCCSVVPMPSSSVLFEIPMPGSKHIASPDCAPFFRNTRGVLLYCVITWLKTVTKGAYCCLAGSTVWPPCP